MSQHHINSDISSVNNNSFNTFSVNNVCNYSTTADERPRILAWLSPLESRMRHQDIRENRVGGVGDWLLKTEEYRNWFDNSGSESDGSALFCHGNLGVGKTYIW